MPPKTVVLPPVVKQLLPGETLTEYEGFSIYAKESPRKSGATYHFYDLLCEDGKKRRVPGISTIAKVIDSSSGLIPWIEKETASATMRAMKERKMRGVEPEDAITAVRALKVGAEAAKINGMARGTAMHQALEDLIGGKKINPETLEAFPGYSAGITAWFQREKPEPILQEVVVGSPKCGGFAGRLDLLAMIKNKRTLLDLKTSSIGKIYSPAHVQAAGYSLGMTECGMEAPERCVLLGISEAGVVIEEESQATADDFLQMLQAYNTKRFLEKRIREAADREFEWNEAT